MEKKKIVLIAVLLVMAIVSVVGAMIVILVSNTQSATSNINIVYSAEDVFVELSAKAWVGKDSYDFRVNGDSNGSTILTLSPDNNTGSLSQVGDIWLSKENDRVIFEYRFENKSSEVDSFINLELDINLTNIIIEYAYSSMNPLDDVTSVNVSLASNYTRQLLGAYADPAQRVQYIYVITRVEDLMDDADLSGSFKWSLGRVEDNQSYNVTINQYDTSTGAILSQPIEERFFIGDTISEPDWTAVVNKRFNGWYLDSSLQTPALFPLEITNNISLYADYQDANLLTSSFYKYDSATDSYYILGELDTTFTNTTLIIPDLFNGSKGIKPVTRIDQYTSDTNNWGLIYKSNIQNVYIGNNILDVNGLAVNVVDEAYSSSNQTLKYVEMGRKIENIGLALFNCSNLETLRLPAKTININAYYKASTTATKNTYVCGLEGTKVYSNNIYISAFDDPEYQFLIKIADSTMTNTAQMSYWDDMECVAGNLFDKLNFNTVSVPASMTIVPANMFFNMSASITKAYIHNSVKRLGDSSFNQISQITSIDIPNSVIEIGNKAFYQCVKINSLYIPNSVEKIENSAFASCDGLSKIVVSANNLVYDSRNNCNAIIESATDELIVGCKQTIVPNDVKVIGSYAFFGIPIQFCNIPNSVTSIGSYTFAYSDQITNIVIPNSVTSIGNYAFYSCDSLASVTLGEGLTTIGSNAFYSCTMLTNIDIPNSVTKISQNAFRGSGLSTISFGENSRLATLGTGVFWGTSLETIVLPESVVIIPNYSFYQCNLLKNVVIGTQVTSLGGQCFGYCRALEKITIRGQEKQSNSVLPATLLAIGSGCFAYTNISSLTIPASCNTIGKQAFRYMTSNFTSLTFESPNGWIRASDSSFTTDVSTGISLSDSASNATNFKSSSDNEYSNFYWKRV